MTLIGSDSTEKKPFTKLLAANSIAKSYSIDTIATAKYVVTTAQGIYDMPPSGNNLVLVVPFGSDAADETFNMKVWGERNTDGKSGEDVGKNFLAIPLIEVTCTLGATAGTADFEITDGDLVCDAITYVAGTTSYEISNPGGNETAYFVIDAKGFSRLLFQFDNDTAADANALVTEY